MPVSGLLDHPKYMPDDRRERTLLSMPLTSSCGSLVQPDFPVGDGVSVAFVPTPLTTVLTTHAMSVRSAQCLAMYMHGAIVYVDAATTVMTTAFGMDGWMVYGWLTWGRVVGGWNCNQHSWYNFTFKP